MSDSIHESVDLDVQTHRPELPISLGASLQKSVTRPGRWVVVGASVIGQGHSRHATVCQDAHYHQTLDHGWGVAVVCDGAGSRPLSHLGAQFVVQQAAKEFSAAVRDSPWYRNHVLPDQQSWETCAEGLLRNLYDALERYAASQSTIADELACTIIVVIYSPIGLLVTHIGDGRAGWHTAQGGWQPVLTPFKGEEANITVFLSTPDVWRCPAEHIESKVVAGTPTAFVLLSDGCEMHAFECGVFDEQQQRYTSRNQPFPGFFDPIARTLERMVREQIPEEDIQTRWQMFLTGGTAGLRDENDDKTMVFGIYLEE